MKGSANNGLASHMTVGVKGHSGTKFYRDQPWLKRNGSLHDELTNQITQRNTTFT
uniref:Uncharacterized protein n=1 Tax=Anguilla anguilla TaxID=7936 RepID=A0A0E9XE23_ANGAN